MGGILAIGPIGGIGPKGQIGPLSSIAETTYPTTTYRKFCQCFATEMVQVDGLPLPGRLNLVQIERR